MKTRARANFRQGLLAVWLGWAASASQAAPPSLQDLFATPLVGAARLSPDGYSVALLLRDKDKPAGLARLDLRTMKPQPLAFLGEEIYDFAWVNDQRLVYINADKVLGINADGSNERALVSMWQPFFAAPTMGREVLTGRYQLADVSPRAKGNDIFLTHVGEASREKLDYYTLVRLDAVTGRSSTIEAPLHAYGFALDPQGELQATISKEGGQRTVHLRKDSGRLEVVARFDINEGTDWLPQWIGPDGQVYASVRVNGDKAAVHRLDRQTLKPVQPALAASRDFDVQPVYIASHDKLLGLRYTLDAEVTQWLDPQMKAVQARVDELLGATANRLSPPMHGDSPWVLVQAAADVQPTLTYAYNRQTDKLVRLGSSLPGVAPPQLGQTDFVRFKARDGLDIPAYLTLPPGGGKQLPLVVLVHGGPWVRGGHWRFDPEVQFLASRGYAVLQPEFRGSAGFGDKHLRAGFGQWGAAMQDDLADAAKWAVAQGHADPQRICIAGSSYGGYATLMGLARNPEIFKCGISWVGVTSIQLLFDPVWSDGNAEARQYGLARMIGDPVADAERLAAASPVNVAAKIKAPLLLAYGAQDRRVPLVHGERLREALKPHNDRVEWVVYDQEGHGWSKAETRIDFWGRVERFLQANIGKPR